MTFTVGQEMGVSAKALFDKFSTIRYGKIVVEKDPNGVEEYYDLYNRLGNLVCMDGETCHVAQIFDNGDISLQNDDGDYPAVCVLTAKEAQVACFEK